MGTDVAWPDNYSDARSSLKVMEPSNLHAQTNAAVLMRAVHGALSFRVDLGSRGVRLGTDAAWPFTNGRLAKLYRREFQNIILPNNQSINGL